MIAWDLEAVAGHESHRAHRRTPRCEVRETQCDAASRPQKPLAIVRPENPGHTPRSTATSKPSALASLDEDTAHQATTFHTGREVPCAHFRRGRLFLLFS